MQYTSEYLESIFVKKTACILMNEKLSAEQKIKLIEKEYKYMAGYIEEME
jgi:hypothetical protein